MLKTLKRLIAASSLILSMSIQADAAGMDLKQLQSMISGLGVVAKIQNGSVVISDQGKFKDEISFLLNDDGSAMGLALSFEAIPPARRPMIPFAAIMKANALAGWDRFTLGLCEANGAEWLCIGSNFDTATLNKKSLRRIIDNLLATVEADEPLWNQETWAAVSPVADDAKAAFEAAWEANPMQAQHAMFVSEKAPNYGNFTKRTTSTFKPGESLQVYVEPKYFAWKVIEDEKYTFGVAIDVALLNEKGEVIYEKLDSMGHLSFQSRERLTELMLNLSFDLTGAPSGSYTLRYTLHDLNGPKSCVVALPFKLEG